MFIWKALPPKLDISTDICSLRKSPTIWRPGSSPTHIIFSGDELKFYWRCIRSTPTEMQSMSESDFECFASTGVKSPANAMFEHTNTR